MDQIHLNANYSTDVCFGPITRYIFFSVALKLYLKSRFGSYDFSNYSRLAVIVPVVKKCVRKGDQMVVFTTVKELAIQVS